MQSPVPRRDRLLSGIDWGTGGENTETIRCFPWDWTDIETAPMQYGNTELLEANTQFGGGKMLVDITIRPLHTNNKTVPPDLMNVSFDDPRMIDRFDKLLDYVFTQIPDVELLSLVIGSEMDASLGTDATLWRQWETFFKATSTYAKSKRPGLKVASEAQYGSLTGEAKDFLISLNQYTDIVGVSHYPLNPDFTVDDPAAVRNVFDTVTSIYPGRLIHFYQIGCPSSPLLKSSEEIQARFFKEVFKAWDAHADQVERLNITWQSDIPPEGAEYWANFYHLKDDRFIAYLATLGLQTFDLKDKEAMRVIRAEVQARGW